LQKKLVHGNCPGWNKAMGLYRKLGFVEEGRRPRELKLGPEHYIDEILMYRFV
jgi:ribosomal protein S18 acetylase RimI-like enzyme